MSEREPQHSEPGNPIQMANGMRSDPTPRRRGSHSLTPTYAAVTVFFAPICDVRSYRGDREIN
ncbi:MAG: hypothetical protein WCY72_10165, partial [Lysobacteraceae bacterium]